MEKIVPLGLLSANLMILSPVDYKSGAEEALEQLGVQMLKTLQLVRVPGAFELPLAAKALTQVTSRLMQSFA